jgi:hypothetical protein
MNITGVVLIAVIAFLLGAAAIYFLLNERSRRLRERFGPEYSRTLEETGDRWKAESTLTRRAKRVEKLHIRQLALPERTRFANSWRDVQSRFVDDPQGTLAEADRLIASLMTAEGYPMSDFEQRVADISVDHPEVVENYRGGHRIALRHAQGDATTEDLRQAMVHFRTLFEDLLGRPEYSQTGRTV